MIVKPSDICRINGLNCEAAAIPLGIVIAATMLVFTPTNI